MLCIGLLASSIVAPAMARIAPTKKKPLTMSLFAEGAPLGSGPFAVSGTFTITLPFTGNVVMCTVTDDDVKLATSSGEEIFMQGGGETAESPCGEGVIRSGSFWSYYKPNVKKGNSVGFAVTLLFNKSEAEQWCDWSVSQINPSTPASGVLTASGTAKTGIWQQSENKSKACKKNVPKVEVHAAFTTLGGEPIEALVK